MFARISPKFVLWCFAMSALFVGSVARADARIVEFSGRVQFWTKTCRSEFACDVPVALGAPTTVRESVTLASSPGLFDHSIVLASGEWRADIGFFVRTVGADAPQAGGDYVVVQTRLSREAGDPVQRLFAVECSVYGKLPEPGTSWFPVGGCSAPMRGGSGFDRVGVTFLLP